MGDAYDPRNDFEAEQSRRRWRDESIRRKAPVPPAPGHVTWPLWRWVLVTLLVLAAIAGLVRVVDWYDVRRPAVEPTQDLYDLLMMDRTGGTEGVTLPTFVVVTPPADLACQTVYQAHDVLTGAGLVGPLGPPDIVGFDLAVPDSCLPYVRLRSLAGERTGELYLCGSITDADEVRAVRGPGRRVYGPGRWVLTVPLAVPIDEADALWAALSEGCER